MLSYPANASPFVHDSMAARCGRCLAGILIQAALHVVEARDVSKVYFGSCNLAEKPQPLWKPILEQEPHLWIWAGDSIYADHPQSSWWLPKLHTRFVPAAPHELRKLYAQQRAHPEYSKLVNSGVHIVGTWDDHDYGINDGDWLYAYRNESQAAFLDFIGEPLGSPRRQQPGVYTSYVFDFGRGDGAYVPGRTVAVILLDLRFNKDSYRVSTGDFLGEEQWAWLKHTLKSSTADVHLIVSSLQFLQPRPMFGENWNRFPSARARFLRLLAELNVSVPVLLSGDVHLAELGLGSCSGGFLLECTSSGMTHSWGTRQPNDDNVFSNGAQAAMMWIAQRVLPWRYQIYDSATGAPQNYLGLNFGEIAIDWTSRRLCAIIRGDDGAVKLKQSLPFASLGVGAAGIAGIEDFGPYRGEAPPWKLWLGFAVLALLPILVSKLFLNMFIEFRYGIASRRRKLNLTMYTLYIYILHTFICKPTRVFVF